MPFGGEPRPSKQREYWLPSEERENTGAGRGSAGNRLTATMLNVLAIGAFSAAVFVPNGASSSKITGDITTDGVAGNPIIHYFFNLEAEHQELMGMPLLQDFASILPYVFLAFGLLLHLIARAFAYRG